MDKYLQSQVEEILRSQEKAEKKLVNKVYLIIFSMIFILITIIVVEFKEYSNNYTEYKIGTNELGPKDLVWAGIMGTPPRYYESNEKHGLGYREFDTREIRKALEDAGINLIYRYMSPNRLEFEFERKHPICFYDRQWSNPKEYFKKKRHPILSIPRYYSGNFAKKIFFRKGELSRFEKHLDSKGDIILDSLIKDTSLKTELIRKVEYDGPYANITYGKKQLDGTYYDYVKEKYRKNIDLVILHTNDQIIQMLKWKRFDYQFLDTLEYDDYPWMDGGKNGIETLKYEVKQVTSIDDPDLIFHSVACGNHPLSKIAMPIINEVIATIRGNPLNYDRSKAHEDKLNPASNRPSFRSYLAGMNKFGNEIFQTDKWYPYQFEKLKISPWPLYNTKKETAPMEIKKNMEELLKVSMSREQPHWNLIEKTNKYGQKIIIIINDVDIKINAQEEILWLKFRDNDFHIKTNKILDRKINFSELLFSNITGVQKLTIFSRGIKTKEAELLKESISSPSLKSLTLIETSSTNSKQFLKFFPKQLEELRLLDVPLMGLPFSQTIENLKSLKVLDIQATNNYQLPFWMKDEEIISMVNIVSNNLETLNLVGREDSFASNFPLKAAIILGERNFSHLKNFTLLNFYLDNPTTKHILDALPQNLESLAIGSVESHTLGISSLLLEDFLKLRNNSKKLKRLHVPQLIFSHRSENKIYLPETLEDFLLSATTGLKDSNFHRIIIPQKMKLKNLTITNCELNDSSFIKLLSQLSPKVENIVLDHNKITGNVFFLLSKLYSQNTTVVEIENFSLDSNPINDFGIFSLSKLPWKFKKLNLSNLAITDRSLGHLISHKFNWVRTLNLSNNYLNAKPITNLLKLNNKNLSELYLDNVLSVDIHSISQYTKKKLNVLSLSGNLINDKELAQLLPTLQKNINYLDISGSRITSKGSYSLAKAKLNTSKLFFDFQFGQEEESMMYIYQTLSPFLYQFSNPMIPLSYHNSLLLSQNIPPYLYSLRIPEFEKEECKIILSKLPDALRILNLNEDLKSNGKTLNEIKNNFPAHMGRIYIGNDFAVKERDVFLSNIPNHYLLITPSEYINSYSPQLVKSFSLSFFLGKGPQKSEYYKGNIFPATTQFISNRENDYPKGFLFDFEIYQLKQLRYFTIDCKPFESNEIFNFLEKLPKELLALSLTNIHIPEDKMDTFLNLIPNELRILALGRNSFGVEAKKKLLEFKSKKEDQTGLPFLLIY